jgi:ribosomal protein S18 acetylase RimI-like enzyme
MVCPLAAVDVNVAAPVLPPGYTFRRPEPGCDAAALHALDAASFASVPDYRPHSFTAFSEEHLQGHDLDLTLSCVAEHDGKLVGFLLARRWQERSVAFIDLLGVHPDHQRLGLGSALLLAAFADADTAGLREVQLGVAADNSRALTLYERVGMTPRYEFTTYARRIALAAA